MEYLLLTGLVIIIAGMWYVGYNKGFIRIALSLVLSIVALVASIVLSSPAYTFIKNNTPIYDTINDQTQKYVSEYIEKETDQAAADAQNEAIKKLNLPSSIKNKLIADNTDSMKKELGVETFSEYLAESLADLIVRAISVLALFVLIKLVLRIIMMLGNVISKLPIIHSINKELGGVVGLAEGIIIIWLICILITSFSGTGFGKTAFEAISNNAILNFVYNNNLIVKFIL